MISAEDSGRVTNELAIRCSTLRAEHRLLTDPYLVLFLYSHSFSCSQSSLLSGPMNITEKQVSLKVGYQ